MRSLKRILRFLATLIGRNSRGKLNSDSDIKSFKENAWQSKKMAGYYNREVENRFFNNVTARIFIENIEPNSYVLDVGAGTGRLSVLLAKESFRVLACDISKEMLAHIQCPQSEKPIETLVSNASNIPLESEIFDAIVSMDLMVHFPDWESLLKEQARLCKKGGVVMFNFLSRSNIEKIMPDGTRRDIKDYYYVEDYAPCANELEISNVALKLGLSVEKISPYNYFTANGLFCENLTKNQVDFYIENFNEQILDDNVMDFVKTFEEQIVKYLPISSCVTMFVKLRKI